ncbi:MAG: hypothetical protein CM15mP74_22740 [Halieaceae bacterium]|nr:MAG: hypothetical protein CM15mP74_22740 [Halieaceae bacterium]
MAVYGGAEGVSKRTCALCRLSGHDIRPHLGDIEAPTLVIHAGETLSPAPDDQAA